MHTTPDRPIDLRHYRRVLWRRRWIILLCASTVLCATLIGLSFVRAQYESEVMLLIEDRQPLAAEIEQVLGRGSRGSAGGTRGAEEERLTRMIGRIRSRPFLERVIKILQMDQDPAVLAQARKRRAEHPELTEQEMAIRILTEALAGRIQFGSSGPGLYKIIVVDFSPQNAQLLAKWISELFVDITVQKELEHIRSTRDFGAEQLRVYEEQLHLSEAALERYQGSMIQQSLSSNAVKQANLSVAEALFRRMQDEAAISKARVNPLARAAETLGMPRSDPRLVEDPAVRAVTRHLVQVLGGGGQDVLSMTSPELGLWPPKGQVDMLRRDLYRELEARAVSLYPDASLEAQRALAGCIFAQIDASAYDEVAAELRVDIEDVKRRLETGPGDEMELARLDEEVSKNRELLQSFRAQMVASDVSQAVETTNLGLRIEIIDPAQVPLAPSRPNRPRILLAAMLVGPFVGIAFAFLGELLDPTLRTLDDIKRAAPEPIFGVLPLLSAIRVRRTGWRKYWVPATLGGLVLLTAVFFVTRATLLRDVAGIKEPVRMVDPGPGVSP